MPFLASIVAAALFVQTPIPFEEAGSALLALTSKSLAKGAPIPTRIEPRLEPMHECIDLGALELWVPQRVLNDKFVAKAGPEAKDVASFASELIALQREWLDRSGARGEQLANASASLDALAKWSAELKRFGGPSEELESARKSLQKLFFRRALDPKEHAPIMILAPTRAHYVATVAAAGLIDPNDRQRLWNEVTRRSTYTQLTQRVCVIALTSGPTREGAGPLDDEDMSPEDRHQNAVHQASHLLSQAVVPSATEWWREGLAICDTIATLRADETLCTGSGDSSAGSGYAHMGGPAGLLLWVTRHQSPYRESSSSTYFDATLRLAYGSGGLQVIDLESLQPSLRVPPPLLGEEAGVPELIERGPPGVKKGFAELYRAYCAAFVHWLDTQPSDDERSLLARLCVEIALVPYHPNPRQKPLYRVVERVASRSLGRSDDVDRDLEARFAATLRAR